MQACRDRILPSLCYCMFSNPYLFQACHAVPHCVTYVMGLLSDGIKVQFRNPRRRLDGDSGLC